MLLVQRGGRRGRLPRDGLMLADAMAGSGKKRGRFAKSLRGASLVFTLMLAAPGWAAPAAPPALFDTREVRSANLSVFRQWNDMRRRLAIETSAVPPPCRSAEHDICHYPEWRAFLDDQRDLPAARQLSAGQQYMNAHPYIVDRINWAVEDYWATPGQFLGKHGDCEDFAIAKYQSLRRLGFSTDSLRIVVLQDTNLRIGHAVLAVYLNGTIWILDNQISDVVSVRMIRHYRPIYSINENAWWLHLPK
jgi:predicted transglutaminase-like cysteine proteinase